MGLIFGDSHVKMESKWRQRSRSTEAQCRNISGVSKQKQKVHMGREGPSQWRGECVEGGQGVDYGGGLDFLF